MVGWWTGSHTMAYLYQCLGCVAGVGSLDILVRVSTVRLCMARLAWVVGRTYRHVRGNAGWRAGTIEEERQQLGQRKGPCGPLPVSQALPRPISFSPQGISTSVGILLSVLVTSYLREIK